MRRRVKQTESLEDRLVKLAKDERERAEQLPPGKERDALIDKARQDETASRLTGWLTSPGLQPPR
jgi:hypothetical protein